MVNWLPNNEFTIPATNPSGQSWTRVTATKYNDVGGWAFTYRFGNLVKARFFDDVVTGTAPNAKPTAYTSDVSVETTLDGKTHDEPDISWHPTSRNVLIVWNDRLAAVGNSMDLRYRVFNEAGTGQMSDDIATHKVLESQWRPIIDPGTGRWILSFTGNNKDSAFMTSIDSTTPWALSSDYTALANDVQMPPSIGAFRQTDQHAIALPNGKIFCVWTHVEGVGRIRYRVFNADFTPAGPYVELPAVLTYYKAEPRAAYKNNRIWITYHHETRGGEYWGVDIYAAVLKYNPTTGVVTPYKSEFLVHPATLPGLQAKPEIVLTNTKAFIVFEHFPNGTIPTGTLPMPVYETVGGYSQVMFRMFSLDGVAQTPCVPINSAVSAVNGTIPYCLRPDIALSYDGTKLMVCWTSDDHANIYSVSGSNSRLWARIIDVAKLTASATISYSKQTF